MRECGRLAWGLPRACPYAGTMTAADTNHAKGREDTARDGASWMRAECQGEARRLSSRAHLLSDSGGTARRRHDEYTKLDAVAAGGLSRYGDFSLPSNCFLRSSEYELQRSCSGLSGIHPINANDFLSPLGTIDVTHVI